MAEGGQGAGEVAALLRRHGLRPRKALGQHYLVDPNIVAKIVRLAAVGPGDRVLEVGPGTGTLTRALAATGAAVLAVEVDESLRPLLAESLAGVAVELRFADALATDWDALLAPGEWALVANLPYNVGTPLLLRMLREVPAVTRYVVMVQSEVADRILAAPGSRLYGLPSVVVGLHAVARRGFTVPPQVFHPRPQVDSTVLVVERLGDVAAAAGRASDLAAAAFGQRRKMVRRSLAGVLPAAEAALAGAGLDPTARAEDLAPADYVRLAEQVADAG